MSNRPKEMKISLIDDEYDVEETTRRAAAPRIDSGLSLVSRPAEPKQALSPAQPLGLQRMARSRPIEWELASVPKLPEFHPLEPTAVFINHADPRDISTRISQVLRCRSIEASYEDSKAKVKCITADGVDFRIRLYRGRANYASGIIVEVQRRFGTSPTFHQDARAILDAAQGMTPSPPPPSFGNSSIPLVKEDDYEVDGAASLEFVSKLLGPNPDSRYLALQSLRALTDSSKMGRKTAAAVSREMLAPGNAVGGVVLDYLLREDSDDVYHLRTMAMTILANAVVAVAGEVDQSLGKQMRPALLQALQRADDSARMAQLACVILEYLLVDKDGDAALMEALESARSSGMAHHAGLEKQALQCITKLERMRALSH